MRLYHFMKEKYALLALENRRIKIAEIDKLNDPFEILGCGFPSDAHEKAFNKMKDQLSVNRGMICFSKEYDDPVQWSHYADNHRGICLGFDIDDRLVHEGIFQKVNYSPRRLLLPDYFLEPGARDESAKFMMNIFITKYDKWNYENEYRVFPNLEEKVGDYYFSDFNDELRIKEIILGCKSKIDKQELFRCVGDLNGSVKIYNASMSKTEYRIDKKHIAECF